MVSHTILITIGIAVAAAAAGIAIGIGSIGYNNAFASPSMGMMQQNQQTNMTAATMMMKNMMQMMMQNPELMQQMMNMMMQNPETMQAMMMSAMMNQTASMNMSSSMMMGSGPQQPFNPDAPITIPMIDGYYNGNKVFFIHTEVSDKKMADMMTMMINFPTLYVPQLANVSDTANVENIYVFTNGVNGSGPYGGGPFMFQIDVFDSIPGQTNYSNFRTPYLVTWNDNATARLLTSEEEILQAESNGELTINNTGIIVNVPVIAWTDNNGQNQTASTIDRPFESMPGFDGQVTHVDTDNYVLRLQLKQPATASQQQSAMDNMTMME